jgi:nitrogenase molybdenum-iron protein alpha/beta subunit
MKKIIITTNENAKNKWHGECVRKITLEKIPYGCPSGETGYLLTREYCPKGGSNENWSHTASTPLTEDEIVALVGRDQFAMYVKEFERKESN